MVAPTESSNSDRAPTPNADCHISNKGAVPTDDLLTQAIHSQVHRGARSACLSFLSCVHYSHCYCHYKYLLSLFYDRSSSFSESGLVHCCCPSVRLRVCLSVAEMQKKNAIFLKTKHLQLWCL